MKKKYEKPMILIENFSLSTTIAGDCEIINKNPTEGSCGYPTRNGVVFMTAETGCDYHVPDTNDTLCYHVPIDTANLFAS